jgi:hypothetical protein
MTCTIVTYFEKPEENHKTLFDAQFQDKHSLELISIKNISFRTSTSGYNFIFTLLIFCYGNTIKDREIGGILSTHVTKETCMQNMSSW